jgi:methyl-accepting chemotaxis protein
MNAPRWLPNLTIERRIGLGFAAILALVACISLVIVWSVREIDELTHIADEAESLKSQTFETALLINSSRISLNSFIASGEASHMAHLREASAKAVVNLQALAARTRDARAQGEFAALLKVLGDFDAIAAKLDKLDAERQANVKIVLENGAAITDPLAKLQGEMFDRADLSSTRVVSRAVQASMGMRDAAGRFLTLGGDADRDRALKEADELDFRVSEMSYAAAFREPDAKKALTDAGKSIEAYIEALKEIVRIAPERAQIVGQDLPRLGEEMGRRIDALTALFGQRYAAAQKGAVGTVSLTSNLINTSSAVAILGGIMLAWAIGRSIARPVRDLTHTMEELAAGDAAIEVPSLGRKDELGQMAAALQVFKENARKVAALEAEAKEAEKRLAVEKARAMGELAGQFEIRVMAAVKKVEAESRGVKHSAGSMATAAQSAQQKAARVAAASGGTADGVRTVAQAAGELAASITQIGALVAKSSSIGEQAVAQSTATNATITALSSAAERIGTVVKLIEEIAGRTNLLALNATIEAARAGEAGRGFTIVASEVKSLAQQTAKATSDIAAQIGAIQSSTQAAVAAIGAIGKTITAMRDISTTVSDAIHRQDSATNAIAANIQQAANGTAEVSANIADVTQSSEQTGEAAHGMRSAADLLVGEAEFLKHEVENFLASVRAA